MGRVILKVRFQNADGAYGGQTSSSPTALGNFIRLSYHHSWSVLDIVFGYNNYQFAGNVGLKYYTTAGNSLLSMTPQVLCGEHTSIIGNLFTSQTATMRE